MAHFRAIRAARARQIRAQDVYGMAVRLLERHGAAAAEVAAFAEAEHDILGDPMRKAAWRAVESTVSDLLSRRLSTSGFTVH